jgi:hypothetical protein
MPLKGLKASILSARLAVFGGYSLKNGAAHACGELKCVQAAFSFAYMVDRDIMKQILTFEVLVHERFFAAAKAALRP